MNNRYLIPRLQVLALLILIGCFPSMANSLGARLAQDIAPPVQFSFELVVNLADRAPEPVG